MLIATGLSYDNGFSPRLRIPVIAPGIKRQLSASRTEERCRIRDTAAGRTAADIEPSFAIGYAMSIAAAVRR